MDFYRLEMHVRYLVERYREEAEHDWLIREARKAARRQHEAQGAQEAQGTQRTEDVRDGWAPATGSDGATSPRPRADVQRGFPRREGVARESGDCVPQRAA
jgi:hypothetical protein